MTCMERTKHFLRCGKVQNEEDEDWSVIITPVFSSGESDEDCRNRFLELNEK